MLNKWIVQLLLPMVGKILADMASKVTMPDLGKKVDEIFDKVAGVIPGDIDDKLFDAVVDSLFMSGKHNDLAIELIDAGLEFIADTETKWDDYIFAPALKAVRAALERQDAE